MKIGDSDWQTLVEEIESTIDNMDMRVEICRINGWWEIGKQVQDGDIDASITRIAQALADVLKRNERDVWYAIKFARQYKDGEQAIKELEEEGTKISWNKVKEDLLTDGVLPLPDKPMGGGLKAQLLAAEEILDAIKQMCDDNSLDADTVRELLTKYNRTFNRKLKAA